MFIGVPVGVSCRILYSVVSYFYTSFSGLITSEELIFLLSLTCNYVVYCQNGFLLPLGAWDRLH